METFQAYFEYEMRCGCGIPQITLLGTAADWKSIEHRAALFAEFGLAGWCDALRPVLAEFTAAAEGRENASFWRSMFRHQSGSGPSNLTGWVTAFFPYIKDFKQNERLVPNPYLDDWQRRLEINDRQDWHERNAEPQGFAIGAVPSCVTSVPLKLFWGTQEQDMRLVGGLLGVSQSRESLALAPECGWVVCYDEEQPAPEPKWVDILG